MDWIALLTQQIEAAYAAAQGLIAMTDDDKLAWSPESGTNWLNTGQLLRHITNSCGNTASGFVTGNWNMDKPECTGIDPSWKPVDEQNMLPPASAYLSCDSKEQALEMLEKDKTIALNAIKEAGNERLHSEVSTPPWGGPESSLGAHLLSCIEHLNLHKAQLFYYLKLQGKPVSTMHLWGMS